jgi:hypothetical protein
LFFGTGQRRQDSLSEIHYFVFSSFGAYADIPTGFRLGLVGHFWSPLPATPTTYPNTAGAGVIYQTDFTGDGTVGDPIPGANVGSFGRDLSVSGLGALINAYNPNIANTAKPAGQTLAG